jgi:hypothetical protein
MTADSLRTQETASGRKQEMNSSDSGPKPRFKTTFDHEAYEKWLANTRPASKPPEVKPQGDPGASAGPGQSARGGKS